MPVPPRPLTAESQGAFTQTDITVGKAPLLSREHSSHSQFTSNSQGVSTTAASSQVTSSDEIDVGPNDPASQFYPAQYPGVDFSKISNGELGCAEYPVRNTFIDYPAVRMISLEGFFEERQAVSCPGSRIEQDVGAIIEEATNWSSGAASSRPDPAALLGVQGMEMHVVSEISLEPPVPEMEEVTYAATPPPPAEPVLGSPELPTVGSALHAQRRCKPCAFVLKGCKSGVQCQFCHLCESGEKKRRQKEKLALRRNIKMLWKGISTGFNGRDMPNQM